MLEAAWWGLFGASSLVLGALVVMARRPSPRVLGLVLGFGAGVLISAVSFELVEQAIETGSGSGGPALGFFAGAVTFFGGDWAIGRIGTGATTPVDASRAAPSSPLSIVLGTVLDGIPESAVLGLTLLETGRVGVAVLVAVFVSNLPEAVAATTDLLEGGWSRFRVLVLWGGVTVLSGIASAAGYALLDGVAPGTVAFIFAFAGGAILAMLSTSMVPEGYELAGRPVGLLVTLGFAVSVAISFADEL